MFRFWFETQSLGCSDPLCRVDVVGVPAVSNHSLETNAIPAKPLSTPEVLKSGPRELRGFPKFLIFK
jgi:hypothetical protein